MSKVKVELFNMYAPNGRYVRRATMVTLPNGRVVKFMDRMPKGQAIQQAKNIVLRELALLDARKPVDSCTCEKCE